MRLNIKSTNKTQKLDPDSPPLVSMVIIVGLIDVVVSVDRLRTGHSSDRRAYVFIRSKASVAWARRHERNTRVFLVVEFVDHECFLLSQRRSSVSMQLPVHTTAEPGSRRRSCSNGSVISICSRYLRSGGLHLLNRVEPSDPADPAKHTEKRGGKGQQTRLPACRLFEPTY
jgi:hypothetical protein